MYSYTMAQWLLFFYIYCLIGWIWESCYVSAKKRKWVNRGFLKGPMLPIYGSGAVCVLLITIPVQDNLVLVFIFGMIGATILEYVTGAVMERLFHVRYWDYSDQPLNLNGHICLLCSIAWGVFSILMVRVFHRPIEYIVLKIPESIEQWVGFVITVGFTVDVTKSVQEAICFRDILENLSKNNQMVASIQNHLSSAVETISQDSDEFRAKLHEISEQKKYQFEQMELRREEKKKSKKIALHLLLDEQKQKKATLLDTLEIKIDAAIANVSKRVKGTEPNPEQKKQEEHLLQLQAFKNSLKEAQVNLMTRKDKDYERAFRVIRNNPSAISKRYKEAMDGMKELFTKKNMK